MTFRKMRRFAQEIDSAECSDLLLCGKRGVFCVTGDGEYPYAVPVNYLFEPEEETIYIHSAGEGHKIDALKNSEKACFTLWREDRRDEGDWAWHLTSLIVFGRAQMVNDREIVREKVKKLAYKYFPTVAEADAELKKDNIKRVALIALKVEHMSGKKVYEK